MRSWLLRGLVFAVAMVVVRVVQGAMINAWETQALLISIFLVLIYAIAAVAWGFIDGRSDAAAEPDPDRRADLAMTWLLAGLVAGVLSGVVIWFISLFFKGLYVQTIINEITTVAAFTALLTFVAAIIGVTVGRYLTDRAAERRGVPVGRHRTDESADTDVFAAVGGGRTQAESAEAPTQAGPTAAAGEGEPRTEPQRIQREEGEGSAGSAR